MHDNEVEERSLEGASSDPKDSRLTAEALRTILDRRERFLDFLKGRVHSEELAREILQDTLVRSFEKGGQLRDEETVVAWFYRLLRNAIIDHRRRSDAAARALTRWADESDDVQPALDEQLEGVVCSCIAGLLTTLKPEYADAIRSVDLDGDAVHTFAEENGITPNNAAVRLHRARHALERSVRVACGACATHGCVDCTCSTTSA